MRNTKRHTKPCLYFQTNSCPLPSHECDYAHVIASPEQFEVLKAPQANLRSKPCKFFLAGVCKDGYWCRFKHPAKLSESRSSSSDSTAKDEEAGGSSDDGVDVRDVDPAWKLKPDQHPKYRTRPCRNYLLGKCAYGDRCSYLHSAPSPTSPLSLLSSPPTYLPLTPPSASYIPETPPPLPRVPYPTPISSRPATSRGAYKGEGEDIESSVISQSSALRTRTPSSSSYGTDEPVTPASPDTAPYFQTSSGMPGVPMGHMSELFYSPSAQVVPSPYGIYSPNSSVPMTIVHVPVAIPMYQQVQDGVSRASSVSAMRGRSRSLSQPYVPGGSNSHSSHFKTKPCKFFNETGRCSKGDRCNFIHEGRQSLSIPSSSDGGSDNGSQKSSDSFSERDEQQRDDSSEKAGNFYKIGWRVLGGGVMMGPKAGTQRRHSEDTTSTRLHRRKPATKEPSDMQRVICAMHPYCPHGRACSFKHAVAAPRPYAPAEEVLSPLELGAPIDLKSFSGTLRGRSTPVSSLNASERNALALTFQSYNLSDASAHKSRPIIVVQNNCAAGDDEEELDWGDRFDEGAPAVADRATPKRLHPASKLELAVPSPPALRARSSPSSPVSASLEIPNMLFSAESP